MIFGNRCTMYLVAMFCISLLFSCTTNIELPPLGSSSSLAQAWSYCVFASEETCLPGDFLTICPPGGTLSKACPYSSNLSNAESTFTDVRDNKIYKLVNIGDQVWMAQNLDFEADGSKCYRNDPSNCSKYGRLYNWTRAMEVCPPSWHLPSDADWDELYRYADGASGTASSPYQSHSAGKYLKATTGWNSGGNGTNAFGFAALPGGSGDSSGYFKSIGYYGNWWSASESSIRNANGRGIYYHDDNAYWYDNKSKFDLFSVRCFQYKQ